MCLAHAQPKHVYQRARTHHACLCPVRSGRFDVGAGFAKVSGSGKIGEVPAVMIEPPVIALAQMSQWHITFTVIRRERGMMVA